MYNFKKPYLAFLILCTLPSTHAMEDVPEYINICTLLSLGMLGIKILSIIYNRHKAETEFFNLVMQTVGNNFSAIDVNNIKKYLEKEDKVNPNYKIEPRGQTILMFAIQHSNKELLKYLLQKKNVKVNIADNHGWTPLHYAIELQNSSPKSAKKYVRKLLKHNADPNKQTIWAATPFLFAIRHGYTNLVNLLIKYDANINYKYEQGTSLAFALKRQAPPETIEALCKAEATLINIDNNENSAFHVAINKKYSKKYIQTLVTYSNPREITIDQDKQLKKIIMETLLILRNQNIFEPLQLSIVSYIGLLNNFNNFNKNFCRHLFNMGYEKSFVFHVNNKIPNIIKLLKIKNDENKTALNLLKPQYKQEIKSLIDGNKLQANLNTFNEVASVKNNKLVLGDSKNKFNNLEKIITLI